MSNPEGGRRHKEYHSPDCNLATMILDKPTSTFVPQPGQIYRQEERRVVDPVTGGAKGQKLQRFDLIPPEYEWELAEHYGKGAVKYDDNNWLLGYKWSLSYQALRRHLNQWWRGEDRDPETSTHHLIAVIWHSIALYTYQLRGLGTDNRPKEKK